MSPKPPAHLGVWQEAEPGKQQHDLITWPSSGDGSRRCNPEAAAHPSPLLQSQRDDIFGLIVQLSAESITSSSRQKSSHYLLIYPWLRIPPAIRKLSELPQTSDVLWHLQLHCHRCGFLPVTVWHPAAFVRNWDSPRTCIRCKLQ